MSAVPSAKYGCDNPGAMTVHFKADDTGGLTGIYSIPAVSDNFSLSFRPVATMQSILRERDAAGRAITMDAPGALRRIMAFETAIGSDGRPARLEWASTFGGISEEEGVFDASVPSAWLTRCPN